MSWDFKPGDRVVCVDDRDSVRGRRIFFIKLRGQVFASGKVQRGAVYVVSFVGVGRISGTNIWVPGIRLEGVNGDFMASKFRPVRTTNIDALKAHLVPKPILAEV